MTITSAAPPVLSVEPRQTDPVTSRGALGRWLLILPVLLALAVRLANLAYPGQLFGVTIYDDGVYVGQVMRLLHGVLPYRQYIVVQPPGLMVLLTPVVAFARLWGADSAFAACRLFTVLVDVTNVVLIGRLLRYKGRRAQLVGMTCMALYPAALVSSATVLLEPYLNLFCLLGALTMFSDGRLAGRRRVLLGGVLIGVAGTVKVFAVFPILALVIIWLFRHRNRIVPLIAGAAIGFSAITLPFAVMAPGAFFHEAILDQVVRTSPERTLDWVRVAEIDGSMFFSLREGPAILLGLVAVLVLGSLSIFRYRSCGARLDELECYVLAATVAVLAAFFWAVSFTPHYAAFLGPFAALLLGSLSYTFSPRSRVVRKAIAVVIAVAIAAGTVVELKPIDAGPDISLAGALQGVPAGSCVLADSPALLLAADHFDQVRGCPDLVDTFGTTMVLGGGTVPKEAEVKDDPAVRKQWEQILSKADYLVLSSTASHFLPLTPALEAWIDQSFVVVRALPDGSGNLYRHRH